MEAITVTDEQAGQRLDSFTTNQLKQFSRSSIQALCEQGLVLVNGRAAKASLKLKPGDQINIEYDAGAIQIPEIKLEVIYEDDDCLVINKPAGILTHSKGGFNPEATVATFIAPRLKNISGERAGIVHRLDRGTSGVIICAKNPEALAWLQKQFSQRKVNKTYVAIVAGVPEPQEAIIDMPIERNPKKPQTFRVSNTGKPAVTKYKVLEVSNNYCLLALQPQTGRTHQLRVHLHKLGHPIVGDTVYGGVTAERLMLHASVLELTLPNRTRKVFESPLPPGFNEYMKQA